MPNPLKYIELGAFIMNLWLKIAFMAALPALSHAHTMSPYLLPEVFDTNSNNVSFQSGITIEKFFVPSVNFKTSYVLTDPTGQDISVQAAANLKRFNIGEISLATEGTYHLRTQDAIGSSAKYALVDGRWLRIRPARPNMNNAPKPEIANKEAPKPAANQIPRVIAADQVPENAQTLEVKNVLVAETYITKAKPSPIPKVTNKGFEVKLNTHPNELYVDDALKAQVLYNGKAVPNLDIEVFKGASSYEVNANREQPAVKTNKKGEFEVKFTQPGLYLITTSYPEVNTDNTKQPSSENITYSLSVEVTE
jgi:hypothetical protein